MELYCGTCELKHFRLSLQVGMPKKKKKKKTLARQITGYQGPEMHWFPPVKRLYPVQELQCESSPKMFLMVCTNFQEPADLSRSQIDG